MNSSIKSNSSPIEDEFICNIIERMDVEVLLQLITCVIVSVFGISGNVFVIVLAVKYTTRKSLHHLIINMAVSDIFLSLTKVMEYCLAYIPTNAISVNFKTTFNIVIRFAISVFVTETFITLLIISIERYRVTRTVIIPQPPSRRRGLAVIAGSWLFSLAMAGLPSVARQKQLKLGFKIYVFVVAILYIVMYVLNILTLRRISKPQAIENSLSEQQRQQRRNRIRSAVKMVLYSLLLYTCCYLPVFLYLVIFLFLGPFCSIASVVIQYMFPIINSSFSPVIYCACLSDFRQAAKKLLCPTSNAIALEVNEHQPRNVVAQAIVNQDDTQNTAL